MEKITIGMVRKTGCTEQRASLKQLRFGMGNPAAHVACLPARPFAGTTQHPTLPQIPSTSFPAANPTSPPFKHRQRSATRSQAGSTPPLLP